MYISFGLLHSIFLLVFGCFPSSFFMYNHPPMIITIPESSSSTNSTVPLILAYHKTMDSASFFDDSVLDALEKCPFQCRYSEYPKLYPQADVAIFLARKFRMNKMLSKNRRPERLNVFYTLEASPNEKLTERWILFEHQRTPKAFFNVSMTFRKDSTIWRPYDKFERILSGDEGNANVVWSDEEIDKIIKKKSELALQFVSNCQTFSKREAYLAALQSDANLTIYGYCNNNVLPHNSTRMNEEFEKHYFYLAFENAVCDDYVTEKFWRLKRLIVPVVLKRSILKGILEDEYFIAADDFKTSEELVQRMKHLSQNHQEYKKYFGWTKKYRKSQVPGHQLDNFCKLCEMATKKEAHSIEDIYQWWQQDANCEPEYAKKLARRIFLNNAVPQHQIFLNTSFPQHIFSTIMHFLNTSFPQ